jgi:hypothetical protein
MSFKLVASEHKLGILYCLGGRRRHLPTIHLRTHERRTYDRPLRSHGSKSCQLDAHGRGPLRKLSYPRGHYMLVRCQQQAKRLLTRESV